jgi:predicted TIM-barrel fold metal-dependent hydrolase
VLFHTGIVTTAREAPGEGVSSWHMHPMRLERISREFPQLNLIAAHLGICWNLEAAELARIRPNVYVDLTGTRTGWRVRADRVGMESFLWWPDAFDKVVFGTDVAEHEMAQILSEDVARLRRLEVGPRTRERVFSGNMLGMLG